MSDILVECSAERLMATLNILKRHLPEQVQLYNYIYNYLYHYDKINGNPDGIYSDRWNFRFYTHRNGELKNCTMLAICGTRDYIVYCFTLQESHAELKECLIKTKLIKWENKPFELACDESAFKAVNEIVCQIHPIDWSYPIMDQVMYISKEKVQNLPLNEKLPDDLYLANLDPELHSNIVDDYWNYKGKTSLDLVKQSIELNGGVGLFRRGEEQPISWIVTNDYFAPGFLHTLQSERNKGYAKLIMKLELKRLVEIHGIDLFSFVTVKNVASLALHRKLGFEPMNRITWLQKPL